jgi:hypothetical protein
LKSIIDKNYNKHYETISAHEQRTAFAFHVAKIKWLFKAKTEEVKHQVEEYRKKRMNASDMAIKIEDTEVTDEASQVELAKQMQL